MRSKLNREETFLASLRIMKNQWVIEAKKNNLLLSPLLNTVNKFILPINILKIILSEDAMKNYRYVVTHLVKWRKNQDNHEWLRTLNKYDILEELDVFYNKKRIKPHYTSFDYNVLGHINDCNPVYHTNYSQALNLAYAKSEFVDCYSGWTGLIYTLNTVDKVSKQCVKKYYKHFKKTEHEMVKTYFPMILKLYNPDLNDVHSISPQMIEEVIIPNCIPIACFHGLFKTFPLPNKPLILNYSELTKELFHPQKTDRVQEEKSSCSLF